MLSWWSWSRLSNWSISSINPEPRAFLDPLHKASTSLILVVLFFLAGMLWRNSNKDAGAAFNQGCHVAIWWTIGLTGKMCLAYLMKTFCALSKSMAHLKWTSLRPWICTNNLEEDHMVKGLRIVFLPSLWNIKWIKEDKWKRSFY